MIWYGVVFCFGAAVYIDRWKSWKREAQRLRLVTRVGSIAGLATILDNANKVVPPIVAVSGRVGSDTPIFCHRSGEKAVIVTETAEQEFMTIKHDGSRSRDSELVLSTNKEVPWYLDDGTARVDIVGARNATSFTLNVVSEVLKGSEAWRVLACRTDRDCALQGVTILGVKLTESVLPMGTPLTVVGEAVKDGTGTIRIRQPWNGPFYVSRQSIGQLIESLEAHAECSRSTGMVFSFFGVLLIAYGAVACIAKDLLT